MEKLSAVELAEYEEHQKHLLSLYQKEEDLHPDLEASIDRQGDDPRFWVIRHPLLVSSITRFAVHNYFYALAKARLAKAEAEGDWLAWIGVHAGPYQMGALHKIGSRLDNGDFWEVLGEVFTSIENAYQNKREVRRLLTSKRPGRERMMSDEEQVEFAALPDEIVIHRGYGVASCKLGWSWTTDRKKAQWFADRFAMLDGVKPKLISGECDKGDVIAYFTRRKESEVVVDPKKVRLT